jgi:hypothetical protein
MCRYADATSVGWYRNLGTGGAGGAAWFATTPTTLYTGVNLPSVGLNALWIIPLQNRCVGAEVRLLGYSATHAAAHAAVLGGTQHRLRPELLCPRCPLLVEAHLRFLALSFLLAWTRACSLAANPLSDSRQPAIGQRQLLALSRWGLTLRSLRCGVSVIRSVLPPPLPTADPCCSTAIAVGTQQGTKVLSRSVDGLSWTAATVTNPSNLVLCLDRGDVDR